MKKDVSYEWNNQESIFDFELIKIPSWIKDLLLQKQISKKNIIHTEHKLGDIFDTIIKKKANIDMVIEKEDEDIDFAYEDIEELVNMLSLSRCEKYQDWINVGMCLYNIKKQYLQIWNKWSQKSDNYEKNICEEKWNSFKKTKDGMKIGSLLLWCKTDNKELYDTFMKQHKLNHLILNKFPNDKLILGDTVFVNNNFNYTCLKNKECLIKGDMHIDLPNSMYIEMTDKFVIIKCKHPECFGKIYPCVHQHLQLTKNEMNIAFNVNVTNNNNPDTELIEFQQLDIYDNPILNELVYNSLTEGITKLAEIIYYYYPTIYNISEDTVRR